MKITSSAFEQEGSIPSQYTCDGSNINPPLGFSEIPPEAKSLALIMDDPDAMKPAGRVWDHWLIWNMPPETKGIAEGKRAPGITGFNTGGKQTYGGPCPPDAEHRYYFKLYALDTELDIPMNSTKKNIEEAMQGHILERAELMGRYNRQ